MNNKSLDEILNKLYSIQNELEGEIDRILEEKRQLFRYSVQKGKIKFEESMEAFHESQRTGVIAYIRHAKLRHIMAAPVIYSMFIPILLLDIMVTVYQHICFRLYGIPLIKRAKYMIFDRQKLEYLNIIEKVNCNYCSYSDGVIAYVREIISRTEQYWCPIKHATRTPSAHSRSDKFFDFGDAEAYKKDLDALRKNWDEI